MIAHAAECFMTTRAGTESLFCRFLNPAFLLFLGGELNLHFLKSALPAWQLFATYKLWSFLVILFNGFLPATESLLWCDRQVSWILPFSCSWAVSWKSRAVFLQINPASACQLFVSHKLWGFLVIVFNWILAGVIVLFSWILAGLSSYFLALLVFTSGALEVRIILLEFMPVNLCPFCWFQTEFPCCRTSQGGD